jgi:hypothetical protein
LFRDETVDVKAWIAVNLDEGVGPDAEMVWGKRVKFEQQPRTTDL